MAAPRATNVIDKGVEAGPLRVFALRRPKPPPGPAGAFTLVNVTSTSAAPIGPEGGTYSALSPSTY